MPGLAKGARVKRVVRFAAALVVAVVILVPIGLGAINVNAILAHYLQQGGKAGEDLQGWHRMVLAIEPLPPQEKINRVNAFFNRRLRFVSDAEVWKQSDYWATPLQTLVKGAGDCEDFAIAKYFTLRAAGIPDEQLRLIYVKAKIGGASSSIEQAHMVLAYYPSVTGRPLILDNLVTSIYPSDRRPDLSPVFSFNSAGIFQDVTKTASTGAGVQNLSRWQEVLQRAAQEGFF